VAAMTDTLIPHKPEGSLLLSDSINARVSRKTLRRVNRPGELRSPGFREAAPSIGFGTQLHKLADTLGEKFNHLIAGAQG